MGRLPENFLQGGTLSAHQCGGAYDVDRKGLNVLDVLTGAHHNEDRITHEEMMPGYYYPNHKTIDFYHTHKEDMKLFAEMGFRCLRVSINQTRIFPDGGEIEPNQKGLEFCGSLLEEMLECGIEPVVTILHNDVPFHLVKKYGGWTNRKLIELLERYCVAIFTRYRNRVKYQMTFNEINNMLKYESQLLLYLSDDVVPNEHLEDETAIYQTMHCQLIVSIRAVILGHAINPDFKTGCMAGFTMNYPKTCNPGDSIESDKICKKLYFRTDVQCHGNHPGYALAKIRKCGIVLEMEDGDLKALKQGTVNYVGFSYYMSEAVSSNPNAKVNEATEKIIKGVKNPYLKVSEWGWTVDPVGLRLAMDKLYSRYQLSLFIVEYGLGAADKMKDEAIHDDYRIDYFRAHIEEMEKSVDENGVELMGSTPWGPTNTVSAPIGKMKRRYGFIYVNLDDEGGGTGEQMKKGLFGWYKKVISSNGEDLK